MVHAEGRGKGDIVRCGCCCIRELCEGDFSSRRKESWRRAESVRGRKQKGAMFAIINLESWLAEEAAIVQKSASDQDVYLHEWLQKLEEYLGSSQATRVRKVGHKVCCE